MRHMPARDLCQPPALAYLRHLTTPIGIWQHTQGKTPDAPHGYSIDDVARALIVVNMANAVLPPQATTSPDDPRSLEDLAAIYLGFLERAQLPDGRFHNFCSAEGTPIDDVGSLDSFGRTIWALGHTIHHGITEEQREHARTLWTRARPHVRATPFLRTNAFLILGVSFVLRTTPTDADRTVLQELLRDILRRFAEYQATDWRWFEESLRYSNGAIPLALFRALPLCDAKSDPSPNAVREAAHASLDFLLKETMQDDVPSLIGNKGWYDQGKVRAQYDQQPVDAAAMVLACLAAWKETNDSRYRAAAETWLSWYDGNNVLNTPLLEEDGAVHDGINQGWVNSNCGAESVVTYLLARLRWIELCCTATKDTN